GLSEGGVEQQRAHPPGRDDLGDAAPHLSRSDHTDRTNSACLHAGLGGGPCPNRDQLTTAARSPPNRGAPPRQSRRRGDESRSRSSVPLQRAPKAARGPCITVACRVAWRTPCERPTLVRNLPAKHSRISSARRVVLFCLHARGRAMFSSL